MSTVNTSTSDLQRLIEKDKTYRLPHGSTYCLFKVLTIGPKDLKILDLKTNKATSFAKERFQKLLNEGVLRVSAKVENIEITYKSKRGDDSDIRIVAIKNKKEIGEIIVNFQSLDDDCFQFSPYEGLPFHEDICSYSDVVIFEHLEVKEEARGQGVAKELFTRAMKEAKKKYSGFPAYINASPLAEAIDLVDLVNFYKKFGFKVLKTFPEYNNAALWKDKL